MGYYLAGFEVVGVDVEPQPNYPFEFIQADVLGFKIPLGADAIHTSPPCQAYTKAQKLQGNKHPDLVRTTRFLLKQTTVPWVIENVPGAPLIDPVVLEGSMFGLRTYRPRLFETNFHLEQPPIPPRAHKTTKMGRRPEPGEFMHIVGNFSGVEEGRKAMGIDWMTRDELSEAIPPAYTGYVGAYLHDALGTAVAA